VTKLRAAGRAVELLLIGEGPAADAVRRDAPDGVTVVDQVSNLQDYLALADAVLLPSSFVGESLPLVLLEAMALGKPIIATPVGEIPRLVGSGADAAGILVPLVAGRPDIDALAAAIARLSDGDVGRALGRAARRRFKLRYTLGAMADRYEALYRRCISRRRPAVCPAA
jgi:glycosyltransferase involved in cell wall biosynthesis